MMRIKRTIYIVLLFSLSGCIAPEVATDIIVSNKFNSLRSIDVAVMPFLSDDLTESEIEDVSEDIINYLSNSHYINKLIVPKDSVTIDRINRETRGSSLGRYFLPRIMFKKIDVELLKVWKLSWEEYPASKKINKKLLKIISNKMGVNSVLQFGVTNVSRTRPIHRKIVAETTAELWYTLFSLNGEVLIAGKSIASQANAWSGQLTPGTIEAVDAALEDILEKLPL